MRRWIIVSILSVILLFYMFLYPMFVTTIISSVQNRNLKEIQYKSEVEPKDRKAEIVATAFQTLAEKSNFESYYYMAIDTSILKDLSIEEEHSILYNMKSIHKRPIYFSYNNLKRIGLLLPIKGIRSGICLRVSKVEILNNEKVVITVSYHTQQLGGGGEEMIMKFVDGKWIVESIASTFYA